MKYRVHNSPNLIYSVGTQVVALKRVQGQGGLHAHLGKTAMGGRSQ